MPKTIKHLRPRTELPFDAHLMISEPGRYIDEYLDAGCDSITFHVEIDEPIAPTLRAIREAGRAAGLAVKPGTPLSALEPYAELLDIVLVMTVEPGFGGQSFMKDVARDKLLAARESCATRPTAARSTSTAGSTARRPSSPARSASTSSSSARRCSSRATTWAARSGSSGPSPTRATSSGSTTASRRSRATGWCRSRRLPKHLARRLMDEIEAGGVPVVMLRGDGQMNPDGVRDYDLLVPATVEALVAERHAARAGCLPGRGRRPGGRRSSASTASSSPARSREGPAPAGVPGGRSASRTSVSARSRAAWSILLGVGPTTPRPIADDLARKAAELRIFRDDEGRTNRSLLDVGGAALVVSQFTLFADTRRGRRPGFTGAAPPDLAERLYERFAATLRGLGVPVATGRFGAEMAVELVNDGPFTIWLDTDAP